MKRNLRSLYLKSRVTARGIIRYIYRILPISLEKKIQIKKMVIPLVSWLIDVNDERAAKSEENVVTGHVLFNNKEHARAYYRLLLSVFLQSEERITFQKLPDPYISIVVVLYNQADLTLACLRSIADNLPEKAELILIDNASTDETSMLLDRLDGAVILRNKENLHFLRACNQARDIIRGKYLVLLNNDAQLVNGSIEAAIKTIENHSSAGAVGGKIIGLDGALQEAGSIIWRDGSCLGYGRGDNPDEPEYQFVRPVDYCSGAFLVTYSELFRDMNGFDVDFAPAYYEETDYCVRLWKKGFATIYDPKAIIRHYEFGSSNGSQAESLMRKNQLLFARKHQNFLEKQYPADACNVLFARVHSRRQRVLYIDDRVPRPCYGSGFPRAASIVRELAKNYFVTIYCTDRADESWGEIYADIPENVEVMKGKNFTTIDAFLRDRLNYYDIIWVSRPHNMALVTKMRALDLIGDKIRIVYDAEALTSVREEQRSKLLGYKAAITLQEEIRLAQAANVVLAVSLAEAEEFHRHGIARCHVLGHSVTISPGTSVFKERFGFLFVGALHGVDSPNGDSLLWFTENVWPIIKKEMGESAQLYVVGYTPDRQLYEDRLPEDSQLIGTVADLAPWYNAARVLIIPTRFAAGLPMKAHDAAAHGLPMVASQLIANQLGWQHEQELLSAPFEAHEFAKACVRLYQDESLWISLRDNALLAVGRDAGEAAFSKAIMQVMHDL